MTSIDLDRRPRSPGRELRLAARRRGDAVSHTFTPLECSKGAPHDCQTATRTRNLSGNDFFLGWEFQALFSAQTRYRGAFATKKADHTVVQWFWEALRGFTPEQRAQLLQWTTGHARVPVQGFSHLMGRDGVLRKFTLTSVELSQAVYPRAHTCFNRIDVPLYETKQDLVKGFEFVLELGDQTFSMD